MARVSHGYTRRTPASAGEARGSGGYTSYDGVDGRGTWKRWLHVARRRRWGEARGRGGDTSHDGVDRARHVEAVAVHDAAAPPPTPSAARGSSASGRRLRSPLCAAGRRVRVLGPPPAPLHVGPRRAAVCTAAYAAPPRAALSAAVCCRARETMDPFEIRRDLEQEDFFEDIIREGPEADGSGAGEDCGSGDGEAEDFGDGEADGSGDGEADGSSDDEASEDKLEKRGPSKKLGKKDHFNIEAISPKGQPVAAASVRVTFKNQCGVLVRDHLPITIREWNKTKNVSEDQVADRYKNTIFDDLMSHFSLPNLGSDSENAKQRALVKKWALKKMGELFRAYKNWLWKAYKAEKKPPVFENYLAKQEHNWEEFVRYKESEEAVNLSTKNKNNASEKKCHHHTGRGGYEVAMPKWDAQEDELKLNGITPEPLREGWDTRARNWFLGHEYDMKTCNLVESDRRLGYPGKWIEVTADIKKTKFAPDREKDLLTLVLGNPEKGGRTRGYGPSVPWALGFPNDAETYRSRARAKQRELEVRNDGWLSSNGN
ncbi:hypothetical protein QYE76_008742 [Lolium multiflorum]|uniref:Uncharacterized protein n=1 Tax=Lolium multiflorum TaxID=4521 RepID=A0AAD8X173_LOLMU|nr:hypothetical protein QYE76_008742 [Lolium multiflorum]